MSENNKLNMFFTALSPFVEKKTVDNEEKKINGKDFITWGSDNHYPQMLWELYSECATLQSVVNGTVDYVVGDGVQCTVPNFSNTINSKGETIRDLVQKITLDCLIFGSFAIQVIRNYSGQISELHWVDVSKIRSDEKNEIFYYSDDWSKSYGRVKTLQYPKFSPNDENPISIFYYKGNKSRSTYPTPMWSASIKNVMIDIAITDFHQNELNNNFLGSKLISFNNGIPDDELKLEVERNLNEKFSGADNAGRIMISFAQSKDNAPEVLSLSTDDFDKRYETLEKRNKEQIFVAFRATPLLFGLVSESNGFSTHEYKDSYKLFAKSIVGPIQQDIANSFDKIFNTKNSIEITPFTIKFEEDEEI